MAKKPTSKNSRMMMTDKAMKKGMGHTMAEHIKEYGKPPKKKGKK